MRINKNLPGLLAVAGLAFAAGHFFTDATSVAFPPPGQEEQMSPETKAWMEAGTPGKHHEILNALAGQWDAEFKIWMEPDQEPMVSRGTVTRERKRAETEISDPHSINVGQRVLPALFPRAAW